MAEMKHIRRVVTGVDPKTGKSRIARDEILEAAPLGGTPSLCARVWGADESPKFPVDGVPSPSLTFFPTVNGHRFIVMSFPPGLGMDAHAPEPSQKHDMHRTDTYDLKVVLSGEICLEFDNGDIVTLRPGDTMIETGTNHRWFNPGTEAASLAVFLVGGHPRADTKKLLA